MPTTYIPALNCMQVNVLWTYNGQKCENVLDFSFADSDFETAAPQVAAIVTSQLVTPMAAHMSNRLSYTGLHIIDLSASTGAVLDYTTGYPIVGGNDGQGIDNGVALVVCARTAARGRSARGRNYLGGFLKSYTVDSIFDAALVAAVLTHYNAMRSAASTNGTPEVVVSKQENGVPHAIAVQRAVTNWTNTTRATRSQRRRNPGIGT